MKTLVLLIAAIAFAGQIAHVRSTDCQGDNAKCSGKTGTSSTPECLTDTGKCKCENDKVPDVNGCGTKLAQPLVVGTEIVAEGKPLSLICDSASQTIGMTYTWTHDGKNIEKTAKELIIEKMTPAQAGFYKCETTTEVPNITPSNKESAPKEIKVLKTPIIQGNKDVIKGAPLALSCYSENKDVLKYEWTAPASSGTTPAKPFYTIPTVEGGNLGSYTCTVTLNSVPATSAVHAVSVFSSIGDMCKPVIKGARSINQGDLLFLVCDWNHDLSVEYVWSLPSSKTQRTSKGYIYEVNEATGQDQGAYKCTVKYNGEELESAVFNVAVTSKSPVVVDPVVPGITGITIKPVTTTSKPVQPVAKLNGVTHAAGSVLMMVASLVISNILF